MTPIRIALVDDHSLVRSGIRKLLESMEGITIAGEAGSIKEAWRLLEEEKVDILLLDISLPGESGLEAVPKIRARYPKLKIVLVSMYASESFTREARNVGAHGYVVKDRSPEELEGVIRQVAAGTTFAASTPSAKTEGDGKIPLTYRQVEILRLIAVGRTHREIGEQLFVAEKTVEHHKANIKRILKVTDTAGLILYAVRHGIVSPSEILPDAIPDDTGA